jgi:hypothetical protein
MSDPIDLARIGRHLREAEVSPREEQRAWREVESALGVRPLWARRPRLVAPLLLGAFAGIAAASGLFPRPSSPTAPATPAPAAIAGGGRPKRTPPLRPRGETETRPVAPPLAVRPRSLAATFADSIGVNVRLADYPDLFPVVRARLQELGVRHVMDVHRSRLDLLEALGRLGIASTLVYPNDVDIHAAVRLLGPWLEGIIVGAGGLSRGDSSWAPRLRAALARVHGNLKSDPATARIPVIGPTIADEELRRALGDLSAFVDFGGLGNPFNRVPPGGAFLDGLLAVYGPVYGAEKPRVVAQLVYGTTRTEQGVSPTVQAKYIVRAFFENYRRGVVRTLGPQLVDFQLEPRVHHDALGLLAREGTPKPSFFALKNVLRLVSDPGPVFSPGDREISVGGGGGEVEHLLLHRRDGTALLALWLGVASADADVTERVTVRAGGAAAAILHVPLSGENRPLPIADDGTIAIDVPDHVVLLELPRPAGL